MNVETWMNDVALTLGEDPAVIRGKNLIQKGKLTHYNQLVEESNVVDCWNECLKQSGYYEVREELKKFNAANKWKKRGISIIPTRFGISFTIQKFLNQAGKEIFWKLFQYKYRYTLYDSITCEQKSR